MKLPIAFYIFSYLHPVLETFQRFVETEIHMLRRQKRGVGVCEFELLEQKIYLTRFLHLIMAATRKPAVLYYQWDDNDWEHHIANQFYRLFFVYCNNLVWGDKEPWNSALVGLKADGFEGSLFKKIFDEMHMEKMEIDCEFHRDQVWWIDNSHTPVKTQIQQSRITGNDEEMWMFKNIVEVENEWHTIQREINQLFHLRTLMRTAVFFPPKSISLKKAVSSVQESIPLHTWKKGDRFLLILIPEDASPNPSFFELNREADSPTLVEITESSGYCSCWVCGGGSSHFVR
jgi:hypothetical protein